MMHPDCDVKIPLEYEGQLYGFTPYKRIPYVDIETVKDAIGSQSHYGCEDTGLTTTGEEPEVKEQSTSDEVVIAPIQQLTSSQGVPLSGATD